MPECQCSKSRKQKTERYLPKFSFRLTGEKRPFSPFFKQQPKNPNSLILVGHITSVQTMNEVFTAFLWFWDQNDRNIPFISFKFPFPDFTGVAADGHIKYWISKYTALLFVRQFYLHQYFVTTNHLKHPQITNSNKQALNDNLHYFISLVEDIMRNSALTDVLSYQEHNRTFDPLIFLKDLKKRVEEKL